MNDVLLGQKLIGVNLTPIPFQKGGRISADEIEFIFETHKLIVVPIIDTDEVEYSVVSLSENNPSEKLDPFTGRKLACIWECRNSNGYFDMLSIGFDQLHPSLLILAEGSSLRLFSTVEL